MIYGKKLYTDTKTLYINGKPVSGHYFGNVRYGEPITHDIPIVDFEDLYNTVGLERREVENVKQY